MWKNLPAILSLAREAKELWNSLEGSDRDRIDGIVRQALTLLPTPAGLVQVKGYLTHGKDPLPVRIAGALMHPEARNLIASGDWRSAVGVTADDVQAVRERAVYLCPHCGAMSGPDVSNMHEGYVCPECKKPYTS